MTLGNIIIEMEENVVLIVAVILQTTILEHVKPSVSIVQYHVGKITLKEDLYDTYNTGRWKNEYYDTMPPL